MKHSMISRACKAVVLEGADDEEDDLAAAIFASPSSTPSQLAASFCARHCASTRPAAGGGATEKDEV